MDDHLLERARRMLYRVQHHKEATMDKENAVKLPNELLALAVRRVSDLQEGESGWVRWVEMEVSSEQLCYLSAEAELQPEGPGMMNIKVTRRATGVEVEIPKSQVDIRWKADTIRFALGRTKSLLPVISIKTEQK